MHALIACRILYITGVVLIETPIAKLVQLAADRVEVHFVDNQHAVRLVASLHGYDVPALILADDASCQPIIVGAVFAKTNTRQADIVDKLGLQLKPDGTLVTDMVRFYGLLICRSRQRHFVW